MKNSSLTLALALFVAILCSASAPVRPSGSFLRQLNKRDSVLIGDRLQYGVTVEDVEDGTEFALPDISKGVGDTLVLVSGWKLDTLKSTKPRRGEKALRKIEISAVITSFEEGKFQLPGIEMLCKTPSGELDTLRFEPQVMEIKTMPVDTTSYIPHDLRGQVRYPLTFNELFPYLLFSWLFVTLVILLTCLIMMRKRKTSGESVVREAPHIVALRKLDAYRGNKYWAPERQKAFYSGVTDALREYIASRYGFGAKEMTTAEIFTALKDQDVPALLYDEMKELFENSDFVKFAKLTCPDEDNAKVLPRAIHFVTQTYQTVLDDEAAAAAEKEKQD